MNEHACEGAGGPGAGTRGGYGASLPGVKGAGSLSRVGLGATRLGGVLALLVGLTGALAAPAASQSSRTPAFAGDAAATPGSAWSIQPTPDQTVPNGALLSSSCTSPRACTAVGHHTDGTGVIAPLAESWDGTSWRTQATPVPAGAIQAQLLGVSCPAARTCTAVGFSINSAGNDVPLAERWNGTSWKIQPVPNPAGATGTQLSGVSCSAANACTAVGTAPNATLAERWNGTSWRIQATPNPPGAFFAQLSSVSCPTASTCTAVGHYSNTAGAAFTLAERWNGTSWRIQATPNPAGTLGTALNGVSCSSASACTAVGGYAANGSSTSLTLAERWNGMSWRIQATPNPAGSLGTGLNGVSCSSASACTAVGSSITASPQQDAPLAERWDGTSWRIQTPPNPGNSVLAGLSCPSQSSCTAAGYDNSASGVLTVAEAWDGSSWRIQATPNPAGTFGSALEDVSCSSAGACTAVGFYNDGRGTALTLAERWNGTSWTIQATPNPAGSSASVLSGVSCSSATACTAVGFYTDSTGTTRTLAERWDGTSWTIQATPRPSTAFAELSGVSCSAASACTAVGTFSGSTGLVTLAERWDGTSWTIQATPNPAGSATSRLFGVSCGAAGACTAVGYSNGSSGALVTLAEAWDGTSWTIQPTPNPTGSATSRLFGVSCSAPGACTAVGFYRDSSGAVVTLAERWDGTSWTIQPTPNPTGSSESTLAGVSCSAASACTTVGSSLTNSATLAEAWDGTTWTIQATPNPSTTFAQLNGVSCSAPSACTAVGGYAKRGAAGLTLAEATS